MSDRFQTYTKTTLAVLFACIAFLVLIALVVWGLLSFAQTNDLPQYYAAAKLMLAGKGAVVYNLEALVREEQLYFPALQGRGIGLFLPPFAIPLLLPLAAFSTKIIPYVWEILLGIALVMSIILLSKLFRLSFRAALYFWSFTALSGPVYEGLRIGQIAPLMLLSLVVSLMLAKRNKDFLAGILLSVLLLKPQELIFLIIYFVSAKRYKIILGFLAASSILAIASYFLLGISGYQNYIQLVSNQELCAPWMQTELGATVRGQLMRFPDLPSSIVSLISSVALLFAAAMSWFMGRSMLGQKYWFECGLVAIMPLSLVVAVHCHTYDLLLLIPSILVFSKSNVVKKVPVWINALIALGLFLFALPFYLGIHYQYLLKGGIVNPYFIVLLLLAVFLYAIVISSKEKLVIVESH